VSPRDCDSLVIDERAIDVSTESSYLGTNSEQPEPLGPEAWTLPLCGSAVSLHDAGNKANNLARLAAQGFPVPPGFIFSTNAYQAFVSSNTLAGFIEMSLAGLADGDPTALETASQAVRERFAAGAMPADLADALCETYEAMDSPPVAVRSSATAEDLPERSFAGQQETLLNVVGTMALLGDVVHYWNSLSIERTRYPLPRWLVLATGTADSTAENVAPRSSQK
jgi:hypothetical protein